MLLGALLHVFGLHMLDEYTRWYAFNAPAWMNILLVMAVLVTLLGARRLQKEGLYRFKIYWLGKILTAGAYLLLIRQDYVAVGLSFPWIILPLLLLIENIYPFILYVSIKKLDGAQRN